MNDDTQHPAAPGPAPEANPTNPAPAPDHQGTQPAAPVAPPASESGMGGTLTPPAEPDATLEAAKSEKRETLSRALAAAQEPPRKRGNHGKNAKFTPELFARVIERVRNGVFVGEAIAAEGISRSCFYANTTGQKDMMDTLKEAQLVGPVGTAEAELYRRGVRGTLKPVYQGGKLVGKIREFSDTALIFYLKTAHPAKFAAPDAAISVQNSLTMGAPQLSPELAIRLLQANEEGDRLLSELKERRAARDAEAQATQARRNGAN